jgi:LPS export ABC transporter protein LptC
MRFLVVFLLLSVAGAWILKHHFNENNVKPISPQKLLEEEFSNVNLLRYSKDGVLRQVVNVQKWVHYRDEPEALLYKPRLQLNQDQQTWHILSDEGKAYQSKTGAPLKMVTLQNNVRVQFQNQKENKWELYTEALSLDPEQQTAKTTSWVDIYGGQYHLRSKGMHADLKEENILFQDKVSGEFSYGA